MYIFTPFLINETTQVVRRGRTGLYSIVNPMVAEVLETQGAKASTVTVLTWLSQIDPFSAPQRLIWDKKSSRKIIAAGRFVWVYLRHFLSICFMWLTVIHSIQSKQDAYCCDVLGKLYTAVTYQCCQICLCLNSRIYQWNWYCMRMTFLHILAFSLKFECLVLSAWPPPLHDIC